MHSSLQPVLTAYYLHVNRDDDAFRFSVTVCGTCVQTECEGGQETQVSTLNEAPQSQMPSEKSAELIYESAVYNVPSNLTLMRHNHSSGVEMNVLKKCSR